MLERLKQFTRDGLCQLDRRLGYLHQLHGGSDYVVTGIPRSGTSLTCSILTSADNGFCFNEVHPYYRINFELLRARIKIGTGLPVQNKFDSEGDVASDTNRNSHDVRGKSVDKSGGNLVIGTKHNVPYLNRFDHVSRLDLPIVTLVRDPLFTLLSWNSDKVASIPEARLTDDHLTDRFGMIDFVSDDRYEMQAQIWEHYADLIWRHRTEMTIVTYEGLTEQTSRRLERLADQLGLVFSSVHALENRNLLERYDSSKIDQIEQAVERFCPSRQHFGYR